MKISLPRFGRKKPFRLFVAGGGEAAPPDRWFASLEAALRAAEGLDERWRKLAWIIEYGNEPRYGGIPVVRDIVHMRDGVLVQDAGSGSS